jgi:signal-transduction protein with cAMP-binding, CBS, and nucleotidyltransferase domain
MPSEQTVMQAKRLEVWTCGQDELLGTISRRMVAEDVSTLVVVDQDGFLAGIITRTDLLRAFIQSKDWQNSKVSEFMNLEVVAVPPDTSLLQVAELLLDKHIHRVVVVREEQGRKRPLSVVSSADLVYHMVKEMLN